MTAVAHHVEEGENEVLRALQKAVDEATLARLGEAFARVLGEELARSGSASRPPPTMKSGQISPTPPAMSCTNWRRKPTFPADPK